MGAFSRLMPMETAPKDRTSILALIRRDLATFHPHYGMSSPELYAGLWVVIRHPGLSPCGFDMGWGLAGPFGAGLGPDVYFEGWVPLPSATDFESPAATLI